MNDRFHRLLICQTSKWSDYTNKEMFDKLFIILYNWIVKQDDILINNEIEFKYLFYSFLCRVYVNTQKNEYEEYYAIKFSEDIVDLFIQMKEVSQLYGSFFLHEKGRTSDDLLQFILQNIIIDESSNDDEFYEIESHEYE